MIEAIKLGRTVDGISLLSEISFSYAAPGIYGIIGPNGAGKTSLLRLLSGVDRPTSGEILLDGKPIADYPRKALARKMAVLQQGGLPPVGYSVEETVALGRYPYQGWFGDEQEDAKPIIEDALTRMGLSHLRNRSVDQLSGGNVSAQHWRRLWFRSRKYCCWTSQPLISISATSCSCSIPLHNGSRSSL